MKQSPRCESTDLGNDVSILCVDLYDRSKVAHVLADVIELQGK